MVNECAVRDFEYRAVHLDGLSAGFIHEPSNRIEGFVPSDSVPFVFRELVIIIGIDDGKLAPCKGYATKSISIAE